MPVASPSINVNKQNYRDTIIALLPVNSQALHTIRINPSSKSQRIRDSLLWKEKMSEVSEFTKKIFNSFKGYVNSINIRDPLTEKFQISIFPFVGTNHRLSGSVYNRLSVNLIGGYAGGLNGFEAGGVLNIEKENVRGVQIAGLLNLVGDSVQGSQMAGLINITGKNFMGFQGAGLMNVNEGRLMGFQLAGLMNINSRSDGTSLAGLMNISKCSAGFEIAGLANVNDTLSGMALAGLFNVSKYNKNGAQVAALFNKSEGGNPKLQVAGLFNSASFLSGIQVGLLNFADSSSGVPIGALSFVKNGVHQFELSADELFLTSISFRTGVNAFHNVLSAGLQPGSEGPLWHFGYGLGTSFKIKNKWRSDLMASVHHVSQGKMYFATSELLRFYWGAEYKFGEKFAIAGGPTFNVYITDALLPDYQTIYQDIGPPPLFDNTNSNDFNFKGWIGARVSLRFL